MLAHERLKRRSYHGRMKVTCPLLKGLNALRRKIGFDELWFILEYETSIIPQTRYAQQSEYLGVERTVAS